MPPKFLLTILTCHNRQQVLANTLASLTASDWDTEPLIRPDKHQLPNPCESQTKASYDILNEANQRTDYDYLLFCEDDIAVNKHIRHNLNQWLPVVHGFALVATLYNTIHEQPQQPTYHLFQPDVLGGSQAIIIKRSWLPEVLNQWESFHPSLMQDLRIYRSLAKLGQPLYVHNPGLVQHQDTPSTWNGPRHNAITFDEEWKA